MYPAPRLASVRCLHQVGARQVRARQIRTGKAGTPWGHAGQVLARKVNARQLGVQEASPRANGVPIDELEVRGELRRAIEVFSAAVNRPGGP
jgi:hypothetical protein